jgi:hypothetical protein
VPPPPTPLLLLLLLPPPPPLLQWGGCGAPMPLSQTGMLSHTLILMTSESGRDGNESCRPV